jgi:aspartyl-tRNA synthetase
MELPDFPRMSYEEAVMWYGNDKPDVRFDMKFVYLRQKSFGCALLEHDDENSGLKIFDESGSCDWNLSERLQRLSRKQLDELTEFVNVRSSALQDLSLSNTILTEVSNLPSINFILPLV